MAFLDININVSDDRTISCHWYQKLTHTGFTLNFRSCAPLRHKKSVIQGTVPWILNATSDWQSFDKGHKKNQEISTGNHYSTEWSISTLNETFDRIVTKGKVTEKPPKMNNFLRQLGVLIKTRLKQDFWSNREKHQSKFWK